MKIRKICYLLVCSFLICSCSKATRGGGSFAVKESAAYAPRMSAKMTAQSAGADYTVMDDAIEYEEAFENGSGGAENFIERKLIKNGNLQIEVQGLSEAENAIIQWCNQFEGYVESSYMGETGGNMSVRIPSRNFESAMNSAGDLGVVKSKNVSSEDVSERFYDLQTRLETKKIMRERLQSYLESAKDVKDMIQIEKELNSVITEIESMEGRMKRLSGQIEYSQIFVNFNMPFRADDNHKFVFPDFGNGFRRFVSNVIDFLIGLVKIVFYIILFGIPIIAVTGFFYWLLLGKVGLLKKLFIRLSGRDKRKQAEKPQS